MTKPRPLRVLALIDSLNWGGAEMLLADLARGGGPAGLELSVAYLSEMHGSPAAGRLRELGVEPAFVPIEGLAHPSALRAVRRRVAAAAPDIVHTHLAYADILGGVAARSLGIPSVSTVHVMGWERAARERVKAGLAAAVRRRCAARVLAVSASARDAYLATGWDAAARVVTVHNGSAARPRPGAGAAVRAELGLAAGDLVLGMVAVLRPGKGHDVAIAATRALRESFADLKLLVVGDGPAAPQVRQMAAALGEAAILTGHRDDVMDVLDAVDVLVHPSRADALPTVLLEAMAAGVPIVATPVGGIPEIVEHGMSGILLRAVDDAPELVAALEPLLADERLRRRLGAAGRRRFDASFSAESWAMRMRGVYDEVLRAHAAGGPDHRGEPRRGLRRRARAARPPCSPT